MRILPNFEEKTVFSQILWGGGGGGGERSVYTDKISMGGKSGNVCILQRVLSKES